MRSAPVMGNRVAGLLSQMFRYGIHRQVVESSPVQLLFRPGGTERPRQRALDDGELAALLANVDEVSKRARRTGIAKLDVRPDIAERCLNHAQPGIIATYDTHHYVEEKRGALTQWTVHLEALRAGT